jgi:prepilin-type N-terminal cleavage/methylation domain-containing protein
VLPGLLERRRARVGDAGFTLVELIVAMVILGVVLVSLIGVQISAAVTIASARDRQAATALANQSMEQMRAMPYNALAKGLVTNFVALAGGDTRVTGTNLKLQDTPSSPVTTYPLLVGKGSQNLAQPLPPLFTSTGSNKQVVTDVTGTANTYTIRGYVTDLGGSVPPATVGLIVTVDWTDRAGKPRHTFLISAAYRGGGCGNLDTQPFLGACQALFDSSSSSGTITTQVSAGSVADETSPTYTGFPLPGPSSSNPFYSLAVGTAGVSAVASSQQVTIVRAIDQYGGTTVDDNDPATDPMTVGWGYGFDNDVLGASDDPSLSELPANPTDLANAPGTTATDTRSVGNSSDSVSFQAQSDYRRSSTADASATASCLSGIPVKQPCAYAKINNFPQMEGGSGYILMYVKNQTIRLSRRIEDLTGNGSNSEEAWAARYQTSPSTLASRGCTTLTAEGCVAAGANRTMATLAIGTAIASGSGTTSSWNGQAPEGLVLVQGVTATCPAGLTESVLVQRGASQKSATETVARCGSIRYWNGSSYTTSPNLTATVGGPTLVYTTTPVTLTIGSFSITATAVVTVSPPARTTTGPANCDTDACTITADAGVISIDATYTVTGFGTPFVVSSGTLVNPPAATASYKATPVA